MSWGQCDIGGMLPGYKVMSERIHVLVVHLNSVDERMVIRKDWHEKDKVGLYVAEGASIARRHRHISLQGWFSVYKCGSQTTHKQIDLVVENEWCFFVNVAKRGKDSGQFEGCRDVPCRIAWLRDSAMARLNDEMVRRGALICSLYSFIPSVMRLMMSFFLDLSLRDLKPNGR